MILLNFFNRFAEELTALLIVGILLIIIGAFSIYVER